MPNIKSAKKRVSVTEKKTAQNKMIKSEIKTATKKFLKAVDEGNKEEATKLYSEVSGLLDSACSKGILHKNNAANKKSGLAVKMNKKFSNCKTQEVVEEVKVEEPAVEEAPVAKKTTRKSTKKTADAE